LAKHNNPAKKRIVYDPRGHLRVMQKAIHRRILLPAVTRSPYSHGGVRGRSPVTSLREHAQQAFVYTADVAGFFPSIHHERIRNLFTELGCSLPVARTLTRLCTFDYSLAQGFPTSPLLADLIIRPVDYRIGKLCEGLGLTYTRFIDDITISAPFDLENSGIPSTIHTILRVNGFRQHEEKTFACQIQRQRFSACDSTAAILM
jgi:RNA-directed DNA polymerase